MRIQTGSKLTDHDVHNAVNYARYQASQDIWIDDDRGVTVSKRGAITFYCHSTWGKYTSGRHDNPSGFRAASWTAWGWVIAELFTHDPDAHIGHYRNRDHFIRSIYSEQRRYILRHSLGIPRDDGPGSDCSFLTLFHSDVLTEQYNLMR